MRFPVRLSVRPVAASGGPDGYLEPMVGAYAAVRALHAIVESVDVGGRMRPPSPSPVD